MRKMTGLKLEMAIKINRSEREKLCVKAARPLKNKIKDIPDKIIIDLL